MERKGGKRHTAESRAAISRANKGKKGPRKYKVCLGCGFCGYGKDQFPSHSKGLCSECWNEWMERKRCSKQRICKSCRKEFVATEDRRDRNRVQKFCSRQCAGKAKTARLRDKCICEHCGKEVTRQASRMREYAKHFCGNDCRQEWQESKKRVRAERLSLERSQRRLTATQARLLRPLRVRWQDILAKTERREIQKEQSRLASEGWMGKFGTMISTHQYRQETSVQCPGRIKRSLHPNQVPHAWKCAFLNMSREPKEKDPWKLKMAALVSSQRKRVRRKSHRQSLKQCCIGRASDAITQGSS